MREEPVNSVNFSISLLFLLISLNKSPNSSNPIIVYCRCDLSISDTCCLKQTKEFLKTFFRKCLIYLLCVAFNSRKWKNLTMGLQVCSGWPLWARKIDFFSEMLNYDSFVRKTSKLQIFDSKETVSLLIYQNN